MDNSGKWFDDISVGDMFSRSVSITEAHLVMSCGILGDFNPLHMDEEFAKKSRFGGRILHGMMTSAIMGGPIGMYFYGTAIAYLEHNARFRAPVRPGDTLAIAWTVTGLVPKPKHGGGIVELVAVATNQQGVVAVEADGKVLAAFRPRVG
jgi:3-hydroxybutyryl-CoA dehydratase